MKASLRKYIPIKSMNIDDEGFHGLHTSQKINPHKTE